MLIPFQPHFIQIKSKKNSKRLYQVIAMDIRHEQVDDLHQTEKRDLTTDKPGLIMFGGKEDDEIDAPIPVNAEITDIFLLVIKNKCYKWYPQSKVIPFYK